MLNLAPLELLILLVVLVGIPVAVGFGLYWLIRKAVADGQRETQERHTP
jgi:hypothetical protein